MIGFAEWIRIKDFQTASENNWIGLDMKNYTSKELLNFYIQSKEKIIESFEIEMECTQQDVNGDCSFYTIGCGDLCKPKLNSDGNIVALNVKYK